jgi:predicted nucleic acid-binding protein
METWSFEDVDAGEASTIALAALHPGALVLMDDAAGRARAAARGIEVLDIAGVLLAAKRAGLIAAVQPLVGRLARGGFRLSEEIRSSLLRDANELPADSK